MGFEDVLRDVAFTMARFTAFAAHALLFGLVAILLIVLRPSFRPLTKPEWDRGRARISARLEGLVQASLMASVVATLIVLLLQSILNAEIRGDDIDLDAMLAVFETSFGQWSALRLPLAVGLSIMLVSRVRDWSLAGAGDSRSAPSPAWWVAWAGMSLALLATSSLSGHAAVATPRWVSLVNDVTHLAAGSVWFTGVIVLAVILPSGWRAAGPDGRLRLLASSVERFSHVGMVTIGIVAVTGAVNSLLHVGKLSDFIETGYGKTLLIKIAIFSAILPMGGINHYFVRARLLKAVEEGTPTASQKLFRKTIAVELVIALSIVGVTGLLVGLARTKEVVVPQQVEVTSGQT